MSLSFCGVHHFYRLFTLDLQLYLNQPFLVIECYIKIVNQEAGKLFFLELVDNVSACFVLYCICVFYKR